VNRDRVGPLAALRSAVEEQMTADVDVLGSAEIIINPDFDLASESIVFVSMSSIRNWYQI